MCQVFRRQHTDDNIPTHKNMINNLLSLCACTKHTNMNDTKYVNDTDNINNCVDIGKKMVIHFNEFIKDKTTFHHPNECNYSYSHATKCMFVENAKTNNNTPINMFMYKHTETIHITENTLKTSDNGGVFMEYSFGVDCDMMTNFRFNTHNLNVTLKFIIGNDEYNTNELTEFLFISSVYDVCKLKITLNDTNSVNVNSNNYIELFATKCLFDNNMRFVLARNKIITNGIVYENGKCSKCV